MLQDRIRQEIVNLNEQAQKAIHTYHQALGAIQAYKAVLEELNKKEEVGEDNAC